MKKAFLVMLAFLITCILSLQGDNFRFEKKEEIKKTLTFQNPSQPKDLQVDNIFGSIVVTGYNGTEVKLTAHKTIKARTEGRIEKAQQEVRLDITEEGNTIDIYVDGPFRCRHKNDQERRHDPGYRVHYDFEIKIPRKTSIFLKTVTDGDINVSSVQGEFDVKNVNGEIIMIDLAGSGKAHTVNGEVKVAFSKNPDSECSFKTINGDIEVTFVNNLSADFHLKTFHGDAYSDFAVSYLPTVSSSSVERKDGKYVYKSNRYARIRVGSGGPEIQMDTLNGDILIKKK